MHKKHCSALQHSSQQGKKVMYITYICTLNLFLYGALHPEACQCNCPLFMFHTQPVSLAQWELKWLCCYIAIS